MAQTTDQGAGRPADGMESVPGRAVQLLHQAIDRLAADDIDHLSDPGLGEELISLRRSIDTRRALASIEFWTSSATALRGSLWLRASQRMRSKGSAGFSLTVCPEPRATAAS